MTSPKRSDAASGASHKGRCGGNAETNGRGVQRSSGKVQGEVKKETKSEFTWGSLLSLYTSSQSRSRRT